MFPLNDRPEKFVSTQTFLLQKTDFFYFVQ